MLLHHATLVLLVVVAVGRLQCIVTVYCEHGIDNIIKRLIKMN